MDRLDELVEWSPSVLLGPVFGYFLPVHVATLGPRDLLGRVPRMTKWEYMTAPILTHAAKQILDNFGADGWELVQVAPGMNPENLVGYFKRPVQG